MDSFPGFTLVYPPLSRTDTASFSVMLDGTIRLNGKLTKDISTRYVLIYVSDTGDQILIQSQETTREGAHKIKSGGTISADEVMKKLKATGICVPAKYSCRWDDERKVWIGQYVSDYIFPKPKKKPRKPRQKDLGNMIPKEGNVL